MTTMNNTVKETGILFSGPMVRALLDGSKTQTRRPVKGIALSWLDADLSPDFVASPENDICPYGQPGDRLWVRETFFAYGRWETRYSEKKGRDEWHFVDMTLECDRAYQYAADNPDVPLAKGRGATPSWWTRPAIFMPRAASRILPEIVSVHVERLQDISEADAMAEGCITAESCEVVRARRNSMAAPDVIGVDSKVHGSAIDAYCALWGSINGADSWAANHWVWVVEFNRVLP